MSVSEAQASGPGTVAIASRTAGDRVGFPLEGPPQVPLFKGTQYVGNLLALADTVTELIYELLPSTSFTLRSGRSVGETFDLSELSMATKWKDEYIVSNPHESPDPSLFWTTLYDFVRVRAGDDTLAVLLLINQQLTSAVDEADGNANYPVLFRFHLKVVDALLDREELSFPDVLQVSTFLYRFRTAFAAVVDYAVPELTFTEPLPGQGADGWSLDVDAVVQVHLPARAADFLTWTLTGTGIEIYLHFDRIVLDDETGLALVNPHRNNDGQTRFPFGGSVGDLTLHDVVVNISVRGELGRATALPIGPYHRYRPAYFTQRSTDPCEPVENLIGLSLSVGSVDLNLKGTALTTLVRLLLIAEGDAEEEIAGAIENGLDGLDDFGRVGDAVAGAFVPFLPDVAVLHTHDIYRPFTTEHQVLTYDHLQIEGDGRGIHILNRAPEPSDPDSPAPGGPPPPDSPPDFDQLPVRGSNTLPVDVLVHTVRATPGAGDALPPGAGGHSPAADLVLAPDQRARYLAGLEAASGLTPEQDAAVRLWLDGVPPRAIAWIRDTDVNRRTRRVAGRRVSAETIASLDRLVAGAARRPAAFLFASSPQWPSTNATLTSLLAPLERISRHGTARRPAARTLSRPLQFELKSPLARRKGSAVDPLWVGLSVNVVAVTDAIEVLVASDTLGQSGSIEYGGEEIPFRVDLEAGRPTVRVDLSGQRDSRPVVSIAGLTVHLDEERQPATYTLECQAPMEAVKPDPGCLPDDAIGAFVFNRSCVGSVTDGGRITDAAYLDQLVYRYFVHLRFLSANASVTSLTLTAGQHVGGRVAARTANPEPVPDPGVDDHDVHVTVQELILRQVVQAVLAKAYTAPVVFDPYYARSPVIQSFDAEDGWLNVYERHS